MVSEFLSGFRASPTEIVLVGVLLLVLIAGLVIYSAVRKRRDRRRIERSAEETFGVLVRQHKLSEEEEQLLRDIDVHLARPEKKYMQLKNHAVCEIAARRPLGSGDAPQIAVSALRVRLGYSGMHAGKAPNSSVEIPEDAAVVLALPGGSEENRTIRGRVSRHIPSAFTVRLDPGESTPETGTRVVVIYFNSTGVYQFASEVTEVSNGQLFLAHSEDLSRMQRRQFHRREMHLPVFVKGSPPRENGESPAATRAELVEVGGGGARVYSPHVSFKRGSEVELSFHPDSNEALHVAGTVVKRSGVLHIAFDRIREQTRDRLFKTMFNRG